MTEGNVSYHFKYEFIPKKTDPHLSNFIVYDLETRNTDRARLYIITFYLISKLAAKHNRDLTPYEMEECLKGTSIFDADNCNINALDFFLKFKGEERKARNRIVEHNLQLLAHNGSGFDTWIILNNFPCDKQFLDIIKNGKGINSLRVFSGYIEKNKKQIP